jgi:hypothetical protein
MIIICVFIDTEEQLGVFPAGIYNRQFLSRKLTDSRRKYLVELRMKASRG